METAPSTVPVLLPPLLVIAYKSVQLDEIVRWVKTLSDNEKQELSQLLENDGIFEASVGVTRDWIEEHGGERKWWINIHKSFQGIREDG